MGTKVRKVLVTVKGIGRTDEEVKIANRKFG